MALRHNGKCKGKIVLDLCNMFSLTTPSIRFTDEGIVAGVVELSAIAKPQQFSAVFTCLKCGQKHEIASATNFVDGQCSICSKWFPLKNLSENPMIATVCNNCIISIIEGGTTEFAQNISTYLRLDKNTKFTPLSEVIKLPVRY